MTNYLHNLAPTFQKTIRHITKQIRESNDPDANMVKALADLTRAYLQLKGKEVDPELNGNPDYYSSMLKEANSRAEQAGQKRKKPIKKKITLVKRKTS